MYFPTSAARRVSTVPTLPYLQSEHILSICPSPRKTFFLALTRSGLCLWRVRPCVILAYFSRTLTSIVEHGENLRAYWSPDSARIVISTSSSFLVLIAVEYDNDNVAYKTLNLPERDMIPGPGEGSPMQSLSLQFEGVIRIDGTLLGVSPRKHHIVFSTTSPSSVQRIPWPSDDSEDYDDSASVYQRQIGNETWLLDDDEFSWLVEPNVSVVAIQHWRLVGTDTWITSDGRAYFVQLHESQEHGSFDINEREDGANNIEIFSQESANDSPPPFLWQGSCIYDFRTPKWVQKRRMTGDDGNAYDEPRRAMIIAVNSKFSTVAIGTRSGALEYTNFPSKTGVMPKSHHVHVPESCDQQTGEVCALEWSSDGYVLAVGWRCGWGIFSVGGRCLTLAVGPGDIADRVRFQDTFMYGIQNLFWSPGNLELFALAFPTSTGMAFTIDNPLLIRPAAPSNHLFSVPFAKSAATGQLAPDNTRYAFLQMDDRVLVYRGADQPDMSVINPEADVWQHIKIPESYLMNNWPIRYSSLSSDGRLIAIAGRRGLAHYNSNSGRWKLFSDRQQEQAFVVKGGLLWFHHILIASIEMGKTYQVRLYSRDAELAAQNVLHREIMSSPIVIMSLVDNSLLVYTAENILYHYLVIPGANGFKLRLCGSISFEGIIVQTTAVRTLSWMIPSAQKQLGDPVDDLTVASVLMVVGGQLILLRPRKTANRDVKYDIQVFADHVEFCWIHLRGVGALENSLWAFDGKGLRVWLNALTIESPLQQRANEISVDVQESVKIPLDFYPLSVLMDKGIIIGAECELAVRSNLPFVMFRHATCSCLFIHHLLLHHLEICQVREAITFACYYQELVFFSHALEILLHTVIESEAINSTEEHLATRPGVVLPFAIEFLDHFDVALDVVVGCARKTEMTHWKYLFSIVGNPKILFETCLSSHRLKTAASYLLVLHSTEQSDETRDNAVRLLKKALDAKDWQMCRDVLRFLQSIDNSGNVIQHVLSSVGAIDAPGLQCQQDDQLLDNTTTVPIYTMSGLAHGVVSLARNMPHSVEYTPEGAVTISYLSLASSPTSLDNSIDEAFGSHSQSLGIIIVRDLPPIYTAYRERLLKLAYKFAKLEPAVREKYTDPSSRYSFGWSHGKEIMNGKPDILKGSYYANPTIDSPTIFADVKLYPEYYGSNIWPKPEDKGIEGFEEAFKNLGRFVFGVGCQLAAACQPFALPHLSDSTMSLPQLISKSQTTKARLLHYFPPENVTSDDEPVDDWCGFHLDHSMLTGLCSAMYLQENRDGEPRIVPPPSPTSGLYIRTRGRKLTKVSIPHDCLAFQTGEALALATGNRLQATPHCVRVGSSDPKQGISRETFALFMQPDTEQLLTPSTSFGQFSKQVFGEHYEIST